MYSRWCTFHELHQPIETAIETQYDLSYVAARIMIIIIIIPGNFSCCKSFICLLLGIPGIQYSLDVRICNVHTHCLALQNLTNMKHFR